MILREEHHQERERERERERESCLRESNQRRERELCERERRENQLKKEYKLGTVIATSSHLLQQMCKIFKKQKLGIKCFLTFESVNSILGGFIVLDINALTGFNLNLQLKFIFAYW